MTTVLRWVARPVVAAANLAVAPLAAIRAPRCPVCLERTRHLVAHWEFDHYGEPR